MKNEFLLALFYGTDINVVKKVKAKYIVIEK